MKSSFVSRRAFTLIELMVVVGIAAIIATFGFMALNSRVQISRLETAANRLVTDLNAARSAAMQKGCAVRLIFCLDKTCTQAGPGLVAAGGSNSGGPYVGQGQQPARFYGFLRRAQRVDASGTCYLNPAVSPAPADAWTQWDFEGRPQEISTGVVFSAIYGAESPQINASDWALSDSAEAQRSLWFSPSASAPLRSISVGTTEANERIIAQLSLASCRPSADDCKAYLIVESLGGRFEMRPCSPGGRAALSASNSCF